MAMATATAPDRTVKWETQAELDDCLAECGVTKDQVVRWRRLGLLPKDVEQDSDYHGSVVRFPVGTCAQIKAASALFQHASRRIKRESRSDPSAPQPAPVDLY